MLHRTQTDRSETHHLLAEDRTRTTDFAQLVIGLTRIELRHARDKEARDRLSRMIDLIETLERVQACIARAPYDGIATHLRTATMLWKTVAAPRGIEIELACDETVRVSPRAVPSLALIANELITNSFEHRFPDGRTGRIVVRLERAAGGAAGRLVIADDGIGSAELPDSTNARSGRPARGLQLVKAIAASLGAETRFVSEGSSGTETHVRFPL